MNMMSSFVGPASSRARMDMLTAIRMCGLSGNLKLCLDAGDDLSYSSGQKWLDRSGGGYDFFRGTSTSSEASDPTFNGTVGRRSSGEFFSSDGGDFFTYDGAVETWMRDLSIDNASASFFSVLYVPSDANVYTWCNYGTGSDGVAMQYDPVSDRVRSRRVYGNPGSPGATSSGDAIGSALVAPLNVLFAISQTYGASAVAYNGIVNGALGSSSGLDQPTGTASTKVPTIGREPDGSISVSGARWYSQAIWNVRHTIEQQMALYNTVRGKFSR